MVVAVMTAGAAVVVVDVDAVWMGTGAEVVAAGRPHVILPKATVGHARIGATRHQGCGGWTV